MNIKSILFIVLLVAIFSSVIFFIFYTFITDFKKSQLYNANEKWSWKAFFHFLVSSPSTKAESNNFLNEGLYEDSEPMEVNMLDQSKPIGYTNYHQIMRESNNEL